MSGLRCSEDALNAASDMKRNKDYAYIIFGLVSNHIDVISKAPRDATIEDLREELSAAAKQRTGRYVIYYLPTDSGEDKFYFIEWLPDATPARTKLLLRGSRDHVKGTLGPFHFYHEASEEDDISYEALERTRQGV
ncbi:cofilin [Arthrobotrys megalospora]